MKTIWVLAATDFELAARHELEGTGVGFVRTGMGRDAVASALGRFTSGEAGRLMAVGFAGALQDGMRPGSAWLVREARTPSGAPCPLDPGPLAFAKACLAGRGVGVCELLTTPHLVRRPPEKRRLGRTSGAGLVDLEGYWLARAARRLGAPLVMLKVVSDAADQPVPGVLEGQLARLLDPRELYALAHLGRTALHARRVLAALTLDLARAWATVGAAA